MNTVEHIPSDMATGYRLLTGPSHAHRLRNCVRTGQLQGCGLEICGIGGMPIWSPRLDGFRAGHASPTHMVGDFRFGNGILATLADESVIASGREEHLGIRKELISPANDRIMFDASMRRIRALIHEGCGDRFLFWDLTIREFEARRSGRYRGPDGEYRHPTWNLGDVLGTCGSAALDTRDILDRAEGLYIDSSAHPSFLGWHYLLGKCLGGTLAPEELTQEFRAALAEVWDLLRPEDGIRKVILCGNAKFTRILEDYVRCGSFVLPDWVELQPRYKQTEDRADCLHLFFAAEHGKPIPAQEADAIGKTFGFRLIGGLRQSTCRVMLYDHWAAACVRDRATTTTSAIHRDMRLHPAKVEEAVEAILPGHAVILPLHDIVRYGGMIELGTSLHPTVLGLVKLLALALTGCTEIRAERYFELLRNRMARRCLPPALG